MVASKAILPLAGAWPIEGEGFLIWIGVSGFKRNWQDLDFDSEVHLDAHAARTIPYLIPVASVIEERSRDDPKNVVPVVRSATGARRGRVPKPTKRYDVNIVDRVNRGV